MSAIWIACCKPAMYGALQAEIDKRDAGAQVLRVGDVETLRSMVATFGRVAGVVLHGHGMAFDAVERAVGALAGLPHVGRVVVMVDAEALSGAARLFRAGAMEVVETEVDGVRGFPPHVEAGREEDASALHGTSACGHDDGFEAGRADASRTAEPETHQGDDASPSGHAGGPYARAVADGRDTGHPVEEDGWLMGEGVAAAAPAAPERPGGFAGAAVSGPSPEPGAPIISVLSGRGGCGATTIVASMAAAAAAWGLRCAIVDADLMFGNVYQVLGVERLSDLAIIAPAVEAGLLDEDTLVRASMRVGPNLTIWGPVALPEQAEAMGPAVETLLGVLRRESDVVFVDTSTYWSDAVAAAVSMSDRCLMLGDATPSTATSLGRVMDLAGRLGVPRTRMTSVFNHLGAAGCGEDAAMRFEVSVALGSRARVAEGGPEVRELMSFGSLTTLLDRPGPFATSIKALTHDVLAELGCSVGDPPTPAAEVRGRLRLPWHKVEGGRS